MEKSLSLPFGFLFVNQCQPTFDLPEETAMPEALRPRLQQYRERERREKEAIRYAEEMRMPVRVLPRQAYSSEREAVEALAAALETL